MGSKLHSNETITFEDLAIKPPQEINLEKPTLSSEELAKFPGAAKTWKRNQEFLNRVLSGKEPAERAEILRVVHDAEIADDDPLYAVLLATGQIEKLLFDYPDQIRDLFKNWRIAYEQDLQRTRYLLKDEVDHVKGLIDAQAKQLQAQSEAAIIVHSNTIKKKVENIIFHTAFTKVAANAHSLIIAGGILLGLFGLGGFIGYTLAQTNKPELSPQEPRRLTVNEAIALLWGQSEAGQWARQNPDLIAWARSSEGKYARNLTQWNQALLANEKKNWQDFNAKKRCQNDAEKLGVVLTLEGRVVKGGFCLLWVVPPENRTFVKQ